MNFESPNQMWLDLENTRTTLRDTKRAQNTKGPNAAKRSESQHEFK